MSRWVVLLKPGAENDLARLDRHIRRRVLEKIGWLEDNFDNLLPKPLSNELARLYKLRVGDWRIIYSAEERAREVSIVAIDHRSKIYSRSF